MPRLATALLLLGVSTVTSAAAERTWTDSTGRFQVEAEFVEVQDGRVVLRKADGNAVRVPLNRLSEKDQQYVAEQQRADPAGATDELKITAEAEWGPAPFGPDEDEASGPPLKIAILLRGKAAAQASAFGDLKLETIEDGRGRELEGELDMMMGGLPDDEEQMKAIDRANQFDQHPEDGVRIPIKIEHPDSPLDSIREIRGTVKLRTGGRYEEVLVEDLEEQTVEDETLERAEISIKVSKRTGEEGSQEDGPQFGFGGEAAETIVVEARGVLEPLVRVELVDANAELLDPTMRGSAGFGQRMKHTLGFEDPVPRNARLRLVLHLDAQEIAIPFALEDIDVPAVPEQPAGFPGFPGR